MDVAKGGPGFSNPRLNSLSIIARR